MATRSCIGIENEDGSLTAVYCHWNGSPKWNGRDLLDHYQDRAKVERLLAGGFISILGAQIGERHSFERGSDLSNGPDGVTTYYHRDRGDSWEDVKPREFGNVYGLSEFASDWMADWVYLFDRNGKWLCARAGYLLVRLADFRPVEEWLKED